MYQQQTMVESLQTNRDDAKKIHLISNVGVVIGYMIQNMISLTYILFIEHLINLEVHNLACFYSKRVRFENGLENGPEMDSQSRSLKQTKAANQSFPAFCYECCHFPMKIRWRIGLIGISSLGVRLLLAGWFWKVSWKVNRTFALNCTRVWRLK